MRCSWEGVEEVVEDRPRLEVEGVGRGGFSAEGGTVAGDAGVMASEGEVA